MKFRSSSSSRRISLLLSLIYNAADIILIQALIYSSQINVIAVLGASIALGNLVIQSWSQVTWHKAVHGKMINGRGLPQNLSLTHHASALSPWPILIAPTVKSRLDILPLGLCPSTTSDIWEFLAVWQRRISLILHKVLILIQLILLLWFSSLGFGFCIIGLISSLACGNGVFLLLHLLLNIKCTCLSWLCICAQAASRPRWFLLMHPLSGVASTLLPPQRLLSLTLLNTHLLLFSIAQPIKVRMTYRVLGCQPILWVHHK